MSGRPAIPDEVIARQRQASDPGVSAWVSANAGSGKTYVLAQRVIRLLLEGHDPAKILCLTFTKAAAANMANGVFRTLAEWTALDDEKLDAALRAASNKAPDAARRALARRLFAAALDTPGGLKVQTIHAFCTHLLHLFPFEANVAARFMVLDEAAQRRLLEQLTLTVLLDAANKPDSALGGALATAIAAAADQTLREVIDDAIGERDDMLRWIARAGGVDAAAADLARVLGIDPADSLARVEKDIIGGPIFPISDWPAVAALCAGGSVLDQRQGGRLTVAAGASGAERIESYFNVFIDSKLKPRGNLFTRNFVKENADLAARLTREQGRVVALRARRNAVACRDRTRALLTIAAAVTGRYRAEKDRRGLLDYDDLIDKTLDLLTRVEAAWVHYKLDLGIDHVLIDEAQDTSPKQWEIVKRLVSEFPAGAGARGKLRRSIFAVGDDKQSIYSFQGAEPDRFAEMKRFFDASFKKSGLDFLPVEFKHSFRSAPVILDAVDKVFERPQAFQGLSSENLKTLHEAVRANAPGLVELWDIEQPEGEPAAEGWLAPFDTVSEVSPRVKLAQRIARAVGAWIARGELAGDGDSRRPVKPGDILILVRQRGPLFEAVIRALKNAGIAVAGADRLVLTEHIAVMDLIALADCLLLPDDDLALATVLKSPLFGLDDNDLFAIAWNRGALCLRHSLLRKADNPRFRDAATRLGELEAAARRKSPFAFYAHLLGPGGGRRRILARLGPEAADALDEFLSLALDYESRETPSLQGFVAWLRMAGAEVKRDMEIVRDEVRVMTVHGAKGLEAPFVVLADTTTAPAGPAQRQPRLLALPRADAPPDTPPPLVWAASKGTDTEIVAGAREAARSAAENEYRRLLYVAMTRAADRLIVCGATGARGKPDGCWYDLISDALKPISAEEPADDGAGTVWRYRKGPPEPGIRAGAATESSGPAAALPDWLCRDAPAEPPPKRVITPSAAEETYSRDGMIAGTPRALALARGRLMHRLLQSLPDIPHERREQAARAHLVRAGDAISAAERETILVQALRVLDDARFAPLFAPGSRAEVPIVGRVDQDGRPPVLVSGQVDRLAVTEREVLIADYKTNRPAPRNLEEVPRSYIDQLAAYRAVLRIIHPAHGVRAALLWTDSPDLMEVSAERLDRAWQALTSS